MSTLQKALSNKVLVIAALLSVIASAAYACAGTTGIGPLCDQISEIGLPGILVAAALSIALLGGHGGGPLGMLLVIATPINFFIYLVIGFALRKVGRLFTNGRTS